jgi:hypothetical protein
VGLGLSVVVDAYKEEIACVLHHLLGVLLAENLVDDAVRIAVELQFQDDGRRVDVSTIKTKTWVFVLYCLRLSLSLPKIRAKTNLSNL